MLMSAYKFIFLQFRGYLKLTVSTNTLDKTYIIKSKIKNKNHSLPKRNDNKLR